MASEDANTAATAAQAEAEPDVDYQPVHLLTEKDRIQVATGEEAEAELFKMRAKLFRFDKSGNEWKERGTGDLKLLQHKETNKIRLIMRRDKTHKVCANHYITTDMKLAPNVGSDRSWVWNVLADVSDGEPVAETLAVRFANSENANAFKAKFEDAQDTNAKLLSGSSNAATTDEGSSTNKAQAQNESDDVPPTYVPDTTSSANVEAKQESAEEEKARLKAQEEAATNAAAAGEASESSSSKAVADPSKDKEDDAPPPEY